MMPRIDDPILRAALIAEHQRQATSWKLEALTARTLSEQYACNMRAAVLEQAAHEIEHAA